MLRELDKIKRERAEDKARKEQEQSDQDAATREEHIATANPLLNLAAALGQTPAGLNTTAPGTFSVKKRWDDGQLCFFEFFLTRLKLMLRIVDLVFKNQSMNDGGKPQHFVNDLLRTEFHKYVDAISCLIY